MPRRVRSEISPPPREAAPGKPAPRADELALVNPAPHNLEPPIHLLDSFLTPPERRFVRAHFAVPQVDAAAHELQLAGAVAHPLRLSLETLRALPRKSITATTECAGNSRLTMLPPPVGEPWLGGAVATAQWTGVPLTLLLEQAGLREDAVELLFTGADSGALPSGQRASYARSIPRTTALEEDVLLALEENGAPIPLEHGGPLRLIVPGWFGMASVKWLLRIDALVTPFSGHFQAERYLYVEFGASVKVTRLRVKSLITSHPNLASVRRTPQRVRGFAWSGEAPIERVEVSFAAGDEWHDAQLTGPALPQAWRAFEITWSPRARGRHVLRCRATDAHGNRQPAAPRWNELGYGANGVQSVVLDVR